MKFVKIANNEIKDVVARAIKKADKLYYNINFGSNGTFKNKKLKELHLLMNIRFFMPKNLQDELILNQDYYILNPFRNKDSQVVKDNYGNTVYIVGKDDAYFHKKDVVLFWEIPNYNETDVCYKIQGDYNIIGEGSLGKERGEKTYSSPAVIVELNGDCILSWESTKYKQEIEFNYKNGQFNIGIVENKRIADGTPKCNNELEQSQVNHSK